MENRIMQLIIKALVFFIILFAVLKLAGVVSWSWLWVLVPLWGGFIFLILFMLLMIFVFTVID